MNRFFLIFVTAALLAGCATPNTDFSPLALETPTIDGILALGVVNRGRETLHELKVSLYITDDTGRIAHAYGEFKELPPGKGSLVTRLGHRGSILPVSTSIAKIVLVGSCREGKIRQHFADPRMRERSLQNVGGKPVSPLSH